MPTNKWLLYLRLFICTYRVSDTTYVMQAILKVRLVEVATWQLINKMYTPLLFFQSPEDKGESEEGSDASKSEISLVYEIALKRNLSVNFEVRKIWQIFTVECVYVYFANLDFSSLVWEGRIF